MCLCVCLYVYNNSVCYERPCVPYCPCCVLGRVCSFNQINQGPVCVYHDQLLCEGCIACALRLWCVCGHGMGALGTSTGSVSCLVGV